jgi:hypothetical protein
VIAKPDRGCDHAGDDPRSAIAGYLQILGETPMAAIAGLPLVAFGDPENKLSGLPKWHAAIYLS